MSAEEVKRRQLGRGLSALLGEESADYAELDRLRVSKLVPVEFLEPSRVQPRRRFDEAEIKGLVESVRENGILQPILVRRQADSPDRFEIIAGERRWRAAQLARLHEVPVIVKDLSDGDALEIALVENLQRLDLTPVEEAEGYQRLMEEFSHTQDDLARALGKSRSHIANTLRLLALPEAVKTMLDDGKLSAGHARALLAAADPQARARDVVSRGLNVRQTEALVQAEKAEKAPQKRRSRAKDADTVAVETEISKLLGLRVVIGHNAATGGGTLTIHYGTLEQLDDVLQRLSHAPPSPHASRTAHLRTPPPQQALEDEEGAGGEEPVADAPPEAHADAPAEAPPDAHPDPATGDGGDDEGASEGPKAAPPEDPDSGSPATGDGGPDSPAGEEAGPDSPAGEGEEGPAGAGDAGSPPPAEPAPEPPAEPAPEPAGEPAPEPAEEPRLGDEDGATEDGATAPEEPAAGPHGGTEPGKDADDAGAGTKKPASK